MFAHMHGSRWGASEGERKRCVCEAASQTDRQTDGQTDREGKIEYL